MITFCSNSDNHKAPFSAAWFTKANYIEINKNKIFLKKLSFSIKLKMKMTWCVLRFSIVLLIAWLCNDNCRNIVEHCGKNNGFNVNIIP